MNQDSGLTNQPHGKRLVAAYMHVHFMGDDQIAARVFPLLRVYFTVPKLQLSVLHIITPLPADRADSSFSARHPRHFDTFTLLLFGQCLLINSSSPA
jgi:hypothetical protein